MNLHLLAFSWGGCTNSTSPNTVVPHVRGVFFSILIACLGGCDFSFSRNAIGTVPLTSIESQSQEIRYQGGYVFADQEHVVGIDVDRWGLDSAKEVREVITSCECVRASLIHLEQEPKKQLLVVHVDSDLELTRNVPLAVSIEVFLSDGSMRKATFEFTHLISATTKREE